MSTLGTTSVGELLPPP